MTTAFVLGHGTRTWGEATTWVPRRLKLHFNAEFDANLTGRVAIEVLAVEGASGAVQTYTGSSVPNYELTGDTDLEMALEMSAQNPDTHAYWVGDALANPIRLCTGDKVTCDRRSDEHRCSGLLAVLKDYDEIFLLVCRSVKGASPRATDRLPNESPKESAFARGLDGLKEQIVSLAASDPQAASDLFDSRSPVVQGELLYDADVYAWWCVRAAHEYRRQSNNLDFYCYYLTRPPTEKKVLEQDALVQLWAADAEDVWQTFIDAVYDDTAEAARIWGGMDPTLQVALQTIDRLKGMSTRFDKVSVYNYATHDAVSDFVPTDADWTELARHNANVLYGLASRGESQVRFLLAGSCLLLGADEDHWRMANYLYHQPTVVEGTFVFTAAPSTEYAPTFGLIKGPDVDRAAFQAAIDLLNATGVYEAVIEWT